MGKDDGDLNKKADEGLELRTEELEVDVLGSGSIHANEGEVNLGLGSGG